MNAFIEITDANGQSGFLRSDVIEAMIREPETGLTRVFVSSNGFYRVKDTQAEIVAKIRDIATLKELEGKE